MIDVEKLRSDIEAAQKNMSETVGRVCSLLVKELNECKPESPTWKPEDLIGKLVMTSKNVDADTLIGILDGIDRVGNTVIYTVNKRRFLEVCPLTEAEALALVWRKPGALICPHFHKEVFYTSSNERGSSRFVCSECGAPWNPPTTETP